MLALAAVTAVTGFGLGIVTSYLLPKQKKEVTYVWNGLYRTTRTTYVFFFVHAHTHTHTHDRNDIHRNVHVLTVTLTFESESDKESYKSYWAPLAKKVKALESNCLSYEWLDSTEDVKKAMIFERYVTKRDLDTEHQETLKEFKKNITTPPPRALDSDFAHYQESNTGYMSK